MNVKIKLRIIKSLTVLYIPFPASVLRPPFSHLSFLISPLNHYFCNLLPTDVFRFYKTNQ